MSEGAGETDFTREVLLALEGSGGSPEQLQSRLIELRHATGRPAFSNLLEILTGILLPEEAAECSLAKVLGHREKLLRTLGRDPGLPVATFDYFINVDPKLHSPRMVEIEKYWEIERLAITDTNDRFGHRDGDRVLREVAELLIRAIREVDVAARYGGEEFAVLLPETAKDGAAAVAERIRCSVEERFSSSKAGPGLDLTISGGLASFPVDGCNLEILLSRADEALYAAKSRGKNRIVAAFSERRRSARFPMSETLLRPTLSLQDGSCSEAAVLEAPAWAKNISRSGALVETDRMIQVGSPVRLSLETDAASPSRLTLAGKVVRVGARDEGTEKRFELGIDFDGIGPGELGALEAILPVCQEAAAEEG
ncbi:MAG: hypothetical protein DMF49_01670 [Acidobacteria bacterium]|nr:MAG: hypothetical protein DMF49_01670 [Acidobacteriota bacterium]